MTGVRRRLCALSLGGLMLGLPGLAVAQDDPSPEAGAAEANGKALCMAAYIDNQRLRKEGALLEARQAVRTCANPSCPELVVKDCTAWLEELETSIPSVVLAAKDGAGNDLLDAQVSIDGRVIAAGLDGTAIEIDPGPHRLLVKRGDGSATKQIMVRAGERNRPITIAFNDPSAPVVALPPPKIDDDGPSALLISGGAIAGLGVVGLGIFAGLGIVGGSESAELDDRCGEGTAATNVCTEDEIDAARSKLVGADVALAIGATLTAVGLTLIVVDLAGDDTERDEGRTPRVVTLGLAATPLAGGGFGQLALTF